MEYITDVADVSLTLSVKAKWDPMVDGETIDSRLAGVDNCITTKTKSSRAMWPNYDVVGVEIDRETPKLRGSITRSEVKVLFQQSENELSNVVEEVSNWIEQAEMIVPTIDDFELDHVYLNPKNETKHHLGIDTSKLQRDSMGFYQVCPGEFKMSVSEFRQSVSILFPDTRPPATTTEDVVQSALNEEFVFQADGEPPEDRIGVSSESDNKPGYYSDGRER